MATFGLVVPGRAVDTNFQQVGANQFLITIPNADSINHVVVFLTGVAPLPQGTAGCIFFSLPDPNAPPNWNFLGHLTNEKPSAIYKLANITTSKLRNGGAMPLGGDLGTTNSASFNYVQDPVIHCAQIGISIEPLANVVQMVPAVDTAASNLTSFVEFMNKTVSNLFNYCSSFSRTTSELAGNPFQTTNPATANTQYVPLSTIQNWYENYTRRLSNDQNFWKSLK